jgi:signal peptidase I
MSITSTPNNTKKKQPVKKSALREWADSFIFAVVVATFVRWIAMEAFTIPTSSMENSLLVGDFLFVSKMHYGARTPKTLLQVPLSHQKIWGTNIPSYLDWVQLPQFRLPGFSEIKRGDAVVFNYPHDDYPVDLKTYWIKRCVGVAGDKLEIKDTQIHINGQALENPPQMQFSYLVTSKQGERINDRVFKGLNIAERYEIQNGKYIVQTTPESAKKLAEMPFVQEVKQDIAPKDSVERNGLSFANSPLYKWNKDNMGEFTIPKAGMVVTLDEKTLPIYKTVIEKFEGNENVKVENGKMTINGVATTQYTFKQNYYFMMGDNRHNSLDSRFWGFVPEDHILGKGLFIWFSLELYPQQGDEARMTPDGGLFSRIRWNRIFTIIK